jgi:hypothetical protein
VPLDAIDHSGSIGKGRDSVAVADEHIARVHPEGTIYEFSAPTEVGEHRLDPQVITRNRVAARDVPMDVVCQQCPDRRLITAGVEGLLGLVEST